MKRIALFILITSVFHFANSQNDKLLERLNKKDSLASIKAHEIYSKNNVTNEIHNIFFRNIYQSSNRNEEDEFNSEISRLMPFDNKMIDTVIFIQLNAFGESVYDTSIKSNNFEKFLSNKLHVNTKIGIIEKRYLLMNQGDFFSPYKAFENARLIRSSGIFHDVRIEPINLKGDTNHIVLIYYIQDVFPYGLALSLEGQGQAVVGVENANLLGLNHRINTEVRFNTMDSFKFWGFGLKYTVPNIFKKSFIDAYFQYKNYLSDNSYELGIFRQFARPEFRWAGGNIISYEFRKTFSINGNLLQYNQLKNQSWISHAFPFSSSKTTINAIVTGLKFDVVRNFERPNQNLNSLYNYWNSNFFLYSLGYSRVKFVQDRILNGFGRTEDIPTGYSVNGLYGIELNEFNTRYYYGGQFLGQYYTKDGYYINLTAKCGFYTQESKANQGVFDFNFQNASKVYKMGNFRIRTYLNIRTTIGINHDTTEFITLNDYNGIRGADNFRFRGNSRFTSSFQTNLFLPISMFGFRTSLFGLVELAKIQPNFDNFFQTPLNSGVSIGLAFKNENLIFDVFQIQYGYFPTSSSLNKHGIVLSSIIPFRFQSLDISRPTKIRYE